MTGEKQNLETSFQNAAVESSINAQQASDLSSDFIGELEAAKSAILNGTPRGEVANIISGVIREIKEDLGINEKLNPSPESPPSF